MLINCDSCGSKLRAPESAIGKRVKCPKCGTILNVPAADAIAPSEPTDMAVTPLPPPVEPSGSEVTASAPRPPEPTPPDDMDDDEPFIPPRRRDLDDDDFDVRRAGGKSIHPMAMTSMIIGIAGVAMGTGGCVCCGVFGALIGLACGIMAVIFGYMGKVPGSETYSLVGIICGGVAIALGLIGVVLLIFVIGLNLGIANFNG